MSQRVKPGKLHYAVVSDIHLGHNKNPASRIVANLMAAFPDNAETASLDIIFINGDVFDELLMFNDHDVLDVNSWINYMLTLCKKNNILLRVLEGTPGHDREQSIHFVSENETSGIHASLKYIRELTIEYIPQFDIHVLYVPDELAGGTEQTLCDVKQLMRAKGIEKIDHAMMHGMFEFQLPPHVHAQKHNSKEYLEMVGGLIFIGHDHAYKQHERIYVNGSFDRLAQGYESPKGHMRALQQSDDSWEVTFVENQNAMKFITAKCSHLSLEETFSYLRQLVTDLPEDSHIRVQAEYNHPVFANMDSVIRLAPLISWAKDPQRDKKDAVAPIAESDINYVPITITPDNLGELIMERVVNMGVSGKIMDAVTDMLEELFPYRRKPQIESTSY